MKRSSCGDSDLTAEPLKQCKKQIVDDIVLHINEIENLLNAPLYGSNIEENFPCLSTDDLNIKLVERQQTLENIKCCWEERYNSYQQGSTDRTRMVIPVCVGMSGVGKTRLLEEHRTIFSLMKNSPSWKIGILLLYYNGHSPSVDEKKLPLTFCLGWRLLHRVFIERRQDISPPMDFLTWMQLPLVNTQLQNIDLLMSLRIIRKCLLDNKTDESTTILSIFLGIDEYQYITPNMDDLTTCIVDTSVNATRHGIQLYPLMAGTEWAKIDGPGSAKAHCKKIAVPFLSFKGSLRVANSIFPGSILNVTFRNYLSQLGQITRAVVRFTSDLQYQYGNSVNRMSRENIGRSFSSSIQLNASLWQTQPLSTILKVVAYSIAGVSVQAGHIPDGIQFHARRSNETGLTWQQLADRGLLQLKYADCDDNITVVDVPIIAIVSASTICASSPSLTRIEQAFVKVLHSIISLTCNTLLDPWQKWVHFGAYLHAAKLNAWQMLGYKTVCATDLFRGMKLNILNSISIQLKPCVVLEVEQHLSPQVNIDKLHEKDNPFMEVSLLGSSSQNNYIFLNNANNGEGVDIFFGLVGESVSGETFSILVLDQRERESKDWNKQYIEGLTDAMETMAPVITNDWMKIRLSFSCFSKVGKRKFQLPRSSGIYFRDCRNDYAGPLRNHSCASVLADVNKCSETMFTSLLGNSDVATALKKHINNNGSFVNCSAFMKFLTSIPIVNNNICKVDVDLIKDSFLFPELDPEDEFGSKESMQDESEEE